MDGIGLYRMASLCKCLERKSQWQISGNRLERRQREVKMNQDSVAKGMGIGLAIGTAIVGMVLVGIQTPAEGAETVSPVSEILEPDTLAPLSVQVDVEVRALQFWIEDKKLVEQRKCKQLVPMQEYIENPYSRCSGY